VKHAPSSITQFRRQCVLCMRYKPTVSGSVHNPAHGVRHFICRECNQKRSAT
jgi:hypothetical protein